MKDVAKIRTPFNVMLNRAERDTLNALAESAGVSKGQVIRAAIKAKHSHAMGAYCCGNGEPCFVPQMHHARKVDIV